MHMFTVCLRDDSHGFILNNVVLCFIKFYYVFWSLARVQKSCVINVRRPTLINDFGFILATQLRGAYMSGANLLSSMFVTQGVIFRLRNH